MKSIAVFVTIYFFNILLSFSQGHLVKFEKIIENQRFELVADITKKGEDIVSIYHFLIKTNEMQKTDTIWQQSKDLNSNLYLQIIDLYYNETTQICSFIVTSHFDKKAIVCRLEKNIWQPIEEVLVNLGSVNNRQDLMRIHLIGERAIMLNYKEDKYPPEIIYFHDNTAEYFSQTKISDGKYRPRNKKR